jgi:hypothetical protein
MRPGAFALPGRDSRSVQSIAKTCHESSDNELRQLVRGRLKNGTNDHDARAEEDGSPATEWITQEDASDGAFDLSVRVTFRAGDLPQKHPRL